MRIILHLSKNKEIVPYNYQSFLTGTLHKWLGINTIHNDISLYSFSWLQGAKAINKGLNFPHGGAWFISTYDQELIKQIIQGVQADPSIQFGMHVKEIGIQEDPTFREEEIFHVASPILIKRNIGISVKFYLFQDAESNDLLTETLQTKLKKAGLASDNFSIQFDTTYPKATTKLIQYKNIQNKTSICPVIVRGTPEQIAFTWNVGIGNSTGIGFGSIR